MTSRTVLMLISVCDFTFGSTLVHVYPRWDDYSVISEGVNYEVYSEIISIHCKEIMMAYFIIF